MSNVLAFPAQLSCPTCGRACGDDELSECLRCGQQYCSGDDWTCQCDRDSTELMQRASRPVGLISRLLAVVLMLVSAAVAQQKPAPRVSELVARQSFVLMQFIQEHGKDADYDDFVAQQVDQLRTFSKGKADEDIVELLDSYELAESWLGQALDRFANIDADTQLALSGQVAECGSAVRQSIVGRHVVHAQVCKAAYKALDKAVTEAQHSEATK